MRLVPSPSGSNLPTFFRWCLGGMPAFASGSGSASASASARDADPLARFLRHAKEMKRCCDPIPADQAEILAHDQFLGGEEDDDEEEEAVGEEEAFLTPPLTQQQDLQGQGQSQQGLQAGVGEDDIVMCSVPFTQTQPSSPPVDGSSTPSDGGRQSKRPRKKQQTRKPRICVRKVRVSRPPKLSTPPPSPEPEAQPPTPPAPAPAPPASAPPPAPASVPTPAPMSAPATPASAPPPNPSPELDPLARIIFMIPTRPLPTTGHKNLVELGRHLGLF